MVETQTNKLTRTTSFRTLLQFGAKSFGAHLDSVISVGQVPATTAVTTIHVVKNIANLRFTISLLSVDYFIVVVSFSRQVASGQKSCECY